MSDKNYLSFANEPNLGTRVLNTLVPDPSFAPWSDTLKFSDAHNGTVILSKIQGGLEDCMDANNGSSGLIVHADEWHSGGSQVITIKGGCEDFEISGLIATKGKVVDVDIDNYSDQSHAPSRNIRLNLKTNNGSPVVWRSLMGCKPTILNPEQPYRCALYLPFVVGVAWNRFYQLLKLLRIAK